MTIGAQNPKALQLISLFVVLLVIAVSTFFLYLLVWNHGSRLSSDAIVYLRTAQGIAQGEGFGRHMYVPASDASEFVPTTHYPPLLSMLYAAGALPGLNWYAVPPMLSLICWVALLSGMGLLAYRLSRSAFMSALVVLLAAMTPNFWVIFQHAWSEVVFLPLLVWLMVVLVDLPGREQGRRWRLILAALLLALLMLTRYVGVFVLGAALLWWAWWHWRNLPKLFGGGLILAASALPLAVWLLRNRLVAQDALGTHFEESTHSFVDGMWAMGAEGVSALLPTFNVLRPLDHPDEQMLVALLIVCLLVAAGVVGWHCFRSRQAGLPAPHRTPLVLFLAMYIALYTLVQPFLLFWPMDLRDMATILCLSLPLLGVVLAALPTRGWSYSLIGAWVLVNVWLAFGSPIIHGTPTWFSFMPPRIADITQSQRQTVTYGGSLVSFMNTNPPRTRTLVNNHADMLNWLRSLDSPVVVFTNESRPMMFAGYPFSVTPSRDWVVLHQPPDVTAIPCDSQYPAALVVFRWYHLAASAQEMQDRIEQKCPGIYRRDFEASVVYLLQPSPPASGVSAP